MPAPAPRRMHVGLTPAEVVERIAAIPDARERWLLEDNPTQCLYHRKWIYFQPGERRIVLWRRPAERRFRGEREVIPYPDALELALHPTVDGTTVELRMVRHPLTQSAWRQHVVMLLVMLGFALMISVSLGASMLWLVAIPLAIVVAVQPFRFWRARRQGRSLLPLAYAALVPHELGEADRQGSAFRVSTARALAASRDDEPD